jgi:hypothetical protein
MFTDKERHWIKGPYYNFSFDSWAEWVGNRPYTNASWKDYKPVVWNIKGDGGSFLLQLIYMKPDGLVDMKAVHISVKSTDEVLIRQWIDEQTWLR